MTDQQKALQSRTAAPIFAGAAVGAIVLLVLIFFLIMFLLWKRRRAQSKEDALSRDQIESLLERIVTRSEGDEPYSRKGSYICLITNQPKNDIQKKMYVCEKF